MQQQSECSIGLPQLSIEQRLLTGTVDAASNTPKAERPHSSSPRAAPKQAITTTANTRPLRKTWEFAMASCERFLMGLWGFSLTELQARFWRSEVEAGLCLVILPPSGYAVIALLHVAASPVSAC